MPPARVVSAYGLKLTTWRCVPRYDSRRPELEGNANSLGNDSNTRKVKGSGYRETVTRRPTQMQGVA